MIDCDDTTLAEEIEEAAVEETEDKKALTRSVHITTVDVEVTVTSQDNDENLEKIRDIAVELVDKYNGNKDISKDYG